MHAHLQEVLLKRRRRNAFFLFSLLFAFFSWNIFFPAKIPVPNAVHTLLNSAGIAMDPSAISAGFWPTPHLILHNVHLNITNDVTFDFSVVRVYPDYLALFQKKAKIQKLTVDVFELHVLKTPEEVYSTSKTMKKKLSYEQEVARYTAFLTNTIAKNLKLAYTVEVRNFYLYVDDRDPNAVFVYAKDVVYEPLESEFSLISLTAGIQNWLHARIFILLTVSEKPHEDFRYSFANIFVHTFAKAKNLMDDLELKSIFFHGNAETFIWFRLPLPASHTEVSFWSALQDPKIDLEEIPKNIRLFSWNISAEGKANLNEVFFPEIRLATEPYQFRFSIYWNFRNGVIDAQFRETSNYMPFLHLKSFVPLIPLPADMFFKPIQIRWKTHLASIEYQAKFKWPFWEKKSKLEKATLLLTGLVKGNLQKGSLLNPSFRGKYTRGKIQYLNYQLVPTPLFLFSADTFIGVGDLLPKAKGSIHVVGTLNCNIRHIWTCQQKPFLIRGKNLEVGAPWFARLYRLLNINIFRSWKSLKKENIVQVSSFYASGKIQQNKIMFEKGEAYTDAGNFRFSGTLGIPSLKGEMTLRITPLGFDSVLRPIPVVGGILNSTVDLASQLIFRIAVGPNLWKVKSFSVGKAFDSLKQLFRKN